MDKCPFCGAESESKLHYSLYKCGTWFSITHQDWNRKDQCYETQLATQAKTITYLVELIRVGAVFNSFAMQEVLNRPEVKKIMEGKR